MMSADVKNSIKQQEIKDMVAHHTSFYIYKNYLQNLKCNVNSGCIFHLILIGILSILILSVKNEGRGWWFLLNRKNLLRGGIHTQVSTLNINMTLESETPTPLSLKSSVATNIPSFREKTYFLISYYGYQEMSKEHHLYNDKV